MSWPTGRQFFTSAKRIAVGYISGWTFFSYLYWDMLNKYTLRFTKFFIYVSVKVFIKKYCLMALHSYLTVKVIQMYKFDSYASPRALFKNKKLYFSLESRRSARGFLVRPWATNSRPKGRIRRACRILYQGVHSKLLHSSKIFLSVRLDIES